jgi:hypothetical protein
VKSRVTRREWAAAMALAVPAAAAQTPGAPASADAELTAARERMRLLTEAVRKAEVPGAVEPAFRFEA